MLIPDRLMPGTSASACAAPIVIATGNVTYEISPTALRSYYVDFYLTQALAGGGVSDAVRRLEELDGEFESVLETEDIVALNAAWLRGQEDLLVLADDDLDAHIAGRVARIPDLAERQAAAAEDALLDAPEFEQIIRELCDIAGHSLQRITMGDPNYEHNGESTLAWHFTTEHGDFLMLEDDDEAFMLNPRTKEILAAVELEEADFEEYRALGQRTPRPF